jgi:hypothetical protein
MAIHFYYYDLEGCNLPDFSGVIMPLDGRIKLLQEPVFSEALKRGSKLSESVNNDGLITCTCIKLRQSRSDPVSQSLQTFSYNVLNVMFMVHAHKCAISCLPFYKRRE